MSETRPRVLVNFAQTIDGKITVAPRLRSGPFSLSRHAEDHRRMRQLRASADAILIGAGNLRADDPDLALSVDECARRRRMGEREPYRVVVTRRGDGMKPRQKMFDPSLGGPSIVVHSNEMPSSIQDQLAKVARLSAMGEHGVDIDRMLAWMATDLGVATVLCEGGGVLCSDLFAAKSVDQLFVTVVPRILGGTDTPTLVEGAGFFPDQIPEATLGALERVGDELYLRYDFRWT